MKSIRLVASNTEPRENKIVMTAEQTMRAYHLVLRTLDRTSALTPEALYGFSAKDVVEMYSQKKGVGPGLWYRLKDGRVVDAFGKPSTRARSWYVVYRTSAWLLKQERGEPPLRILYPWRKSWHLGAVPSRRRNNMAPVGETPRHLISDDVMRE